MRLLPTNKTAKAATPTTTANDAGPTEPDVVRLARAEANFQAQAIAITRAREEELHAIETTVIDENNAEAIEAQAADIARMSALLQAAQGRRTIAWQRAQKLGCAVADLVSQIAEQINRRHSEHLGMVRGAVEKQLAQHFDAQRLPAAVHLARALMIEQAFQNTHQPPGQNFGRSYWNGDGTSTQEIDNLQAVVNAYDAARDTLAQVQAHGEELKKSLR